jgi:hypothetical protein
MAWFVPAMMALSTGLTLLGHKQTIKNIKVDKAWQEYKDTIAMNREKQILLEKQTKDLSKKRAMAGKGGYGFTGTPLFIAQKDIEKMEDDLFYLEKGYFIKNASADAKATGLITAEVYKAGSTLLQAGISYNTYTTNKALAEKGILTSTPSITG